MRISGLTSVKMVGSTNQPAPHSGRCAGAAAHTAHGAFFFGDADVVQHLLVLRLGGDGADLGAGIERVAHAGGLGEREQAFDELVVNRPMDERARARDAGLAGGGENAGDHAFHGVVEFGVVENDVGGLAAELERNWLDAPRGQSDTCARRSCRRR